jgi:hypothetical protein
MGLPVLFLFKVSPRRYVVEDRKDAREDLEIFGLVNYHAEKMANIWYIRPQDRWFSNITD